MDYSDTEQTITASEAARRIGVEVYTLRRWCDWHSEHLSATARPGNAQARRLTLRDVEVLRHVRTLRDNGLQTKQINEQLQGMTFAIVDTPGPVEGPPDAPEAPTALTAPIQAIVQALAPFEARIAKLEARRFDVASFAYGVIVAGIFFALMIGLAVLYSR